jgi:hypothetical protein
MGRTPKHDWSDIFFGGLLVGLAALCVYFAASNVIKLQNMDDPPADMGLNFPEKKQRRSAAEAVLVDPLVTGSINDPATNMDGSVRHRLVQPYTLDQPVLDYRLLTVINGIAFVEVTRLKGKEVLPVREGSTLPGAGLVEAIEKVGDHWRLVSSDLMLKAQAQ